MLSLSQMGGSTPGWAPQHFKCQMGAKQAITELGGHEAQSDGGHGPTMVRKTLETDFGCARNFLNNRFVYVVLSPRAHGLSVGVNLNPDKRCNFSCIYCEVDRSVPSRDERLNVQVMIEELRSTLLMAVEGRLQDLESFRGLPRELLQLRQVAISGDGEPTLSPQFSEAVAAVVHLRAVCGLPFFKIVLVTNATGLDQPSVQHSLHALTPQDELWLKLDGGSKSYIERINRPQVPFEKVLGNILLIGKQRPIVIQSLFPSINGQEPPPEEIENYVMRLLELKEAGAQISLVQIYSATRPTKHPECSHLPLKCLSKIAQVVRARTGLRVEVY